MLSAATVAYQGQLVVSAIVGCALVPVVALAWWIAGGEGVGGEFFVFLVFLLAAVAAGDAVKSRHEAAAARRDREALARDAAVREMFDQYRVQLGREMHDSLAHTLVAIATRAGVAVHLHRGHADPELIEAVEDVKRVSANALDQLRTTLQSVRGSGGPPLTAPEQPACAALTELMKPLGLAGLQVRLDCDPAADQAPAPGRHAGFRIVQESLTNVLRHAHAHSVHVSLPVQDNRLVVEVTDDGSGDGLPGTTGHGLLGMRERAHEVSGTVTAGSQRSGRVACSRRTAAKPTRCAVTKVPTSVLIADDQAMVRGGLRALLDAEADLTVVGEAADGVQAQHLARQYRPDIVLMEIRSPDSMAWKRRASSPLTRCWLKRGSWS